LHDKDSYLVTAVSRVTHRRFYIVAAAVKHTAVSSVTAPPVARSIKGFPVWNSAQLCVTIVIEYFA
jgi:hypothetical protein